MSSEKCRNHSQRGRIKSSPKTPNTLRGFDEFVKKTKKSIDEIADKTDIWDNERWGKFRRLLRKDLDKLAKEYRGKFETACCNSNFIEESDVCSKCKEHSE